MTNREFEGETPTDAKGGKGDYERMRETSEYVSDAINCTNCGSS